MFIQPNVSFDIESKLKSLSQGVTGDQMVIEAQSYLRVMGFPIGNFGTNHNGVDGKLGEATRAAWDIFQMLAGSEQPVKDIENTVLTQLEQATINGSSFRSLAGAASAKGIEIPISIKSTHAEFVNEIYYYAVIDEVSSKVPAAATVAQAINESGYGKFIATDINSGQFSYNLFGIKGKGPAGSVTAWTHEENPKTKVLEPVRARFRAYHNFLESIKDHSQFFYDNIHRYGAAFRTNTPAGFVKAIAKAGYATDSRYTQKIIGLMTTWGLT